MTNTETLSVEPDRAPTERLVVALTDAEGSRVGSKAARLGDLRRAGFRVPDGFVVTTDAFDVFSKAAALSKDATSDDVVAAKVPEEIARAIRDALERLGDGPVAVRSSAVAEDLAGASFAGQYETFLDVHGADAVIDAVRKCWASAFSPRVAAYRRSVDGAVPLSVAVLVQRMVAADAAGVAFSADPVTGDRDAVIVSAVRGLGERLVSGNACDDEWRVSGDRAERRRVGDDAIDAVAAREVSALAQRVEAHYGAPQDIEWATRDGVLHLLQARPMTALPDVVRWDAPPGCWLRNFRLGEWIGAPMSPLFETWLLDGIERGFHGRIEEWFKFRLDTTIHINVNGWYFYGFNFLPKTARETVAMLWAVLYSLLFQFRRLAAMTPPLAHLGIDHAVREWREQVAPAYRREVAAAAARVESATPAELVGLVDGLASAAGDYFTSMVAVAGYAAKAELPLATFWHAHVLPHLDASYLELVRGETEQATTPAAHAVEGLDWVTPCLGERTQASAGVGLEAPDHAPIRERIRSERDATMKKVVALLAGQPRRLRKLEALVATARRAHGWREEQSSELTLAWPALRRAALRLGEHLVARGVLAHRDQVFFLKRDELIAASIDGAATSYAALAADRKRVWQRQSRLTPPLLLGELPKILKDAFDLGDRVTRTASAAGHAGIVGWPASPGRATGVARVIRSLDELGRLRAGEILVAPVTTPGWTPAFALAAAVVTDTGSLASHASIVAREYGIPAVVGTADATARLRDGQIVTVDGSVGVVELETATH